MKKKIKMKKKMANYIKSVEREQKSSRDQDHCIYAINEWTQNKAFGIDVQCF